MSGMKFLRNGKITRVEYCVGSASEQSVQRRAERQARPASWPRILRRALRPRFCFFTTFR